PTRRASDLIIQNQLHLPREGLHGTKDVVYNSLENPNGKWIKKVKTIICILDFICLSQTAIKLDLIFILLRFLQIAFFIFQRILVKDFTHLDASYKDMLVIMQKKT